MFNVVLLVTSYKLAPAEESKAQELFDYITDNGLNASKFEDKFEVDNVADFIDDIVSDLDNSALYGFVKVK